MTDQRDALIDAAEDIASSLPDSNFDPRYLPEEMERVRLVLRALVTRLQAAEKVAQHAQQCNDDGELYEDVKAWRAIRDGEGAK